jgi:ribosome-binding ATPase YchF (GTP1/OBG family)
MDNFYLYILLCVLAVLFLILVFMTLKSRSDNLDTELTMNINALAKDLEPKVLDLAGENVKRKKGIFEEQSDIEKIININQQGKVWHDNPFSWTTVSRNTQIGEKKEVELKATPLIFLISDSITLAEITSSFLMQHNYRVVYKEDGKEAMKLLEVHNATIPDMIIINIDKKNVDSKDFVENLRKNKKFEDVPVLVISSNIENSLFLMESGNVQGFLNNPFSEKDLIDQVQYLINK